MISTTKNYAPVSYRRPEEKASAMMSGSGSDSEDSSTTSEVKRRTDMFEKLAAPKPALNGIAIKKGWMANMKAAQGSKYGKKIVGFSALPPKRSFAELP